MDITLSLSKDKLSFSSYQKKNQPKKTPLKFQVHLLRNNICLKTQPFKCTHRLLRKVPGVTGWSNEWSQEAANLLCFFLHTICCQSIWL